MKLNLDKYLIQCDKNIERYKVDMEESRINSEKVFLHENELQEKLKHQAELNKLLEVDKQVEVLMDEDSKEKVEGVIAQVEQVMRMKELEEDFEIEQ